jgi:hypothetical protein
VSGAFQEDDIAEVRYRDVGEAELKADLLGRS